MRKLLLACIAPAAVLGMTGCDAFTTEPDPGVPVDLTYKDCVGSSSAPSWLAVQDGDGDWNRVTPDASGAFNFTIASGRGGIAVQSTLLGLFISYASTEEFQANLPNCAGSVRTVSGTVTGFSSLDNVAIRMGGSDHDIFGNTTAAPAQFQMFGVDADVTDLVAIRFRESANGTAFELFPTSVILRRGVTGGSTSTLDFGSSTDAITPLQRTVDITNVSTGEEIGLLSNIGLATTLANISVYATGVTTISGSHPALFYGVPAAALNSGENQSFTVSATKTQSNGTHESRVASVAYTNPVDQSLTLGPVLGPITPAGTSRPSVGYTIQTGYDNIWDVVFEQGSGTSYRAIEVQMTRGYLGDVGVVNLTVPNLTGVSGFQSSWLMTTGSQTDWKFVATNADLSFTGGRAQTFLWGERTGTFTP